MPRIEDYALIGDLQTAALVGRERVDRLVLLPALRLRGVLRRAAGRRRTTAAGMLAPDAPITATTRRYRHDTLILETVHETSDGLGARDRLHAAARRGARHRAHRRGPRRRGADAVRARDPVRLRRHRAVGAPRRRRAGGRRRPRRAVLPHAGRGARRGPDDASRSSRSSRASGSRSCSRGSRRTEPLPDAIDAEQALADAEEYWLEWAEQCGHRGDYHDEIHQSLLVLKALTYAPDRRHRRGADDVAARARSAAPRNWDYRFCWLRDATLTLVAMLNAGYRDEARSWRSWLLRAVAGDPADLQIMYGIGGERRLDERELEWLPGLRGIAAGAGRATPPRRSCSSTSTARCWTPPTRRACTGVDRRRHAWSLTRDAAGVARGRLAAEGRRHLGGARAGAALHALQGDGVGRVRPRRADARGVRRATGRSSAGASSATEIHAEVLARAWSDGEAVVHAVLRLGRPRRERAADAVGRVHRRHRPAVRLDRRGDPARADRRRPGAPLPAARGRRGGRHRRRARACSCRARSGSPTRWRCRAARRGTRAVRAAARPAQRRRPAVGGVRPGRAAVSSATSRRRSRTWRSSTPRSVLGQGRGIRRTET